MRHWLVAGALSVAFLSGTAAAQAPPPVEAGALWSEFTANELAFTQKYKGKGVAVSGTVMGVVAAGESSYVQVGDGVRPGGGILCHLPLAKLAAVAKGDKRVFSGTVESTGPSGIRMRPCNF